MPGSCRFVAFAVVLTATSTAAVAQYQAPSPAGPAAVVPSSLKKLSLIHI